MNEERKQVFIGNLSYGATEEDVKLAFTLQCVRVHRVRIPFDKQREMPKGYAFVDLDPSTNVDEVIKKIDGSMICGRPCRAAQVRSKVTQPESYKDVWED
jgi:RNA recognition motif-containing protein